MIGPTAFPQLPPPQAERWFLRSSICRRADRPGDCGIARPRYDALADNRGQIMPDVARLASCQRSAASRACFQGSPILNSSIARFVALAVSGASTKLMNLADRRHEPVLFGHLTPATRGLQERGDRVRARQDRRCPFTVFRTIETFLDTR